VSHLLRAREAQRWTGRRAPLPQVVNAEFPGVDDCDLVWFGKESEPGEDSLDVARQNHDNEVDRSGKKHDVARFSPARQPNLERPPGDPASGPIILRFVFEPITESQEGHKREAKVAKQLGIVTFPGDPQGAARTRAK